LYQQAINMQTKANAQATPTSDALVDFTMGQEKWADPLPTSECKKICSR
jgi:hypothetical protein